MMVQVSWRWTDVVLSSFPISRSRKDHTRADAAGKCRPGDDLGTDVIGFR